MVVVDASAGVHYLAMLNYGDWVAERLKGQNVHVPHLFDVEVLNGFRKLVLRGALTPPVARAAVLGLPEFDLRRYPHAPLLERVWELRHNLSSYDATYVALAEALGAPLITTDVRLTRTPGLLVDIIAP